MPVAAPAANAPLIIVLNAGSGSDDAALTRQTIEDVLRQAGREHQVLLVEHAQRLPDVAQRAVRQAQSCQGVVVAAGGDGTINAVAQAALGSGCAFGVLPQGTFNYFGRTHGISQDTAAATRLLLDAQVQPVQVGLVNERVFLVNASLGLYPQLLEDREAYKQQYGRSRLVAIWAGLLTVLRDHRPLRIRLEARGEVRNVRTPTLFVGNNRLQLERIGIPEAQALEEGQLAAITLRPVGTLSLLWLMLRGAFGQLGDAHNVISFGFRQMTVRPLVFGSRRVKVAMDGEVGWLRPPIEFRVSPEPLPLLKPRSAAQDRA